MGVNKPWIVSPARWPQLRFLGVCSLFRLLVPRQRHILFAAAGQGLASKAYKARGSPAQASVVVDQGTRPAVVVAVSCRPLGRTIGQSAPHRPLANSPVDLPMADRDFCRTPYTQCT